ncbi:pseudouridine synthase [Cognaticolwellia mytili]|uniref:pseudouridine synthase n=1 Tax=Cognaticolwellia mytili TaxID=1888913 RepID=UPI000A170901|nr:pseudouridine synthase [Cognaticolwellia mytili]
MSLNSLCFTSFERDTCQVNLPEKFTFPFYYQPHILANMAAEQLQGYLNNQAQWQYDIESTTEKTALEGKMFGVLVVKNSAEELGYLAAYSGQIISLSTDNLFVPPVSSMQLNDDAYLTEQALINRINDEVTAKETSSQLRQYVDEIAVATNDYQSRLLTLQATMADGRKQRKQQREAAKTSVNEDEYQQLERELAGKSIEQKKQLQALKKFWQEKISALQSHLNELNSEIAGLKKLRRAKSKALQKKLFAQYEFLNADGEVKDLNRIFADLPEKTPPSGAGDCAAPKLLQYAYQHNLTPIAMAEFWWGPAPKSAIRQHKNYYPSCYSKCQPILGHMLQGLVVDENPLLVNPAEGKDLTIVHQDDDILVVNKPAEFLSVPGKNIEDSVYLRIKTQFPQASGPLIVHRLDMSTSGLLVIALNKRAHKALQKQFIERTVEKRYVALVTGNVAAESGTIELPLRLDLDDKPRQLVCYQHGKASTTYWEVLAREDNITRLHLYPKTGRTHQLRVHCAHKLGLNMPIVGDDHYGDKAERLHLHAEYLALRHPISREEMTFEVPAEF